MRKIVLGDIKVIRLNENGGNSESNHAYFPMVFYDYIKDGIIETSQVNSFYRRICEAAGIEYNGQHALRHTFATRSIEAGVPPLVLKKWLGHTNIHITLDTYSDVFDKMNFESTDKLDLLMGSLMPE